MALRYLVAGSMCREGQGVYSAMLMMNANRGALVLVFHN